MWIELLVTLHALVVTYPCHLWCQMAAFLFRQARLTDILYATDGTRDLTLPMIWFHHGKCKSLDQLDDFLRSTGTDSRQVCVYYLSGCEVARFHIDLERGTINGRTPEFGLYSLTE